MSQTDADDPESVYILELWSCTHRGIEISIPCKTKPRRQAIQTLFAPEIKQVYFLGKYTEFKCRALAGSFG